MEDKVLVLGGSIRANRANRSLIVDLAARSQDLADFRDNTSATLKKGTRLANSEILAGAAMVGARLAGVDVDYFPLCHLFPAKDGKAFDLKGGSVDDLRFSHEDTLNINKEAFEELMAGLDESRGVVLATPVYFGDRSSVANKFLQMASERQRVQDKVYGVVSVGAKRNGGQETCDIYSLYEMLNQGALCVGNGMPTSQYGGTAVGGDMGHVLQDEWGLHTAFGTGERVAQVSKIVNAGARDTSEAECELGLVVAMDTRDRRLRSHVEALAREAEAQVPGVRISVIGLVDNDIYRCLGCDSCPRGKETDSPHCVIRDPEDFLDTVCNSFRRMDGFVMCGFNPRRLEDIVTRYQVFTERMRFIRRNDYELSNKLVAGLCYHQFGATINPIHSLKVMTSYIRHNTIMHRSIEVFDHDGQLLNDGLGELVNFCRAASLVKKGVLKITVPAASYNPYGEGGGYNR